MFQRNRKGYTEQQIAMLTEVLAIILTGKESGRYEAALPDDLQAKVASYRGSGAEL